MMAEETVTVEIPASVYSDLESLAALDQEEVVDVIAHLVEAAHQQRVAEAPTRAFRRILERATDLGISDLTKQLYGTLGQGSWEEYDPGKDRQSG